MNCREINEHLSAYLDGELEAKFVSQVEEHLASCETCRRELDALRDVVGMMHALPHERAPRELESDVVSYIERDMLLRTPEPVRTPATWRKVLNTVSLAAAVVVLAVAAYVILTPEEPTTERDPLSVVKGERMKEVDDFAEGVRDDQRKPEGGKRGRPAPTDGKMRLAYGDEVKKPGTAGELDARLKGEAGDAKDEKAGGTLAVANGKDESGKGAMVDKLGDKPKGDTSLDVLARADTPAAAAANVPAKPQAAAVRAPEVLDLVIAAQNYEETRTRLVAFAGELDIRAVEVAKLYGRFGSDRPVDDAPAAKRKAVVQSGAGGAGREMAEDAARPPRRVDAEEGVTGVAPRKTARTAERMRSTTTRRPTVATDVKDMEKALKEAPATAPAREALTSDYAAAATNVPAPALVFAVPRDKLPQFIAKLSAKGFRAQIAPQKEVHRAHVYRSRERDGRTATRYAAARPAPTEAKAPKAVAEPEARPTDLDEKRDRGEVPTFTAPEKLAKKAEEKKLEATRQDDLGRKMDKSAVGKTRREGRKLGVTFDHRELSYADPDMVYIQIYLKRAEPVTPTHEPEAEKKTTPAEK